jgi:Tfp pilus assembly protein PilN
MKRKAANININLVPNDPFFDTVLGKTLKWAVSVGRYIVMFTELIVIISFATRFTLDRQVTDLNQTINQKESVIRSYGDLEERVRSTQAKLDQYQQLEQQKNIVDVFPSLSSITPPDVLLNELIIRPTSVTLGGSTLSQSSLNLLINNVQLAGGFYNVSVDRIETSEDQSGLLQFRISADTEAPQSTTTKQRTVEDVHILDRTQGL